jgi:pilus assembly protein CpaC
VELGSGETTMIAGLLQHNQNNSIDQAPGIGDLPVLGALFRSNSWQRGETELMIVITPYLVKPVNPDQIVLPTDGYQAPTDLQRVFLGRLESGKSGGKRPMPSVAPTPGATPAMGAVGPVPAAPVPGSTPGQRPDAIEEKAVPAPVPPRKDKGKAADTGPTPGFSLN